MDRIVGAIFTASFAVSAIFCFHPASVAAPGTDNSKTDCALMDTIVPSPLPDNPNINPSEFGAYSSNVIIKISRIYGRNGREKETPRAEFRISRDGQVSNIQIFDAPSQRIKLRAINAVKQAAPFPKLPKGSREFENFDCLFAEKSLLPSVSKQPPSPAVKAGTK